MRINNNLPPYAEEQTLKQEQKLTIEEILSQFQQPIPSNFIELGQPKKYWGSTEGLDKPLCERYTFKYDNNKSTTLDITQELSDKLELNSKENFHVFKKVLTRSPEEGGITIKNENEIFIQKPLTINNLESSLKDWLTEIEQLKKQITKLRNNEEERQETITNLQEERDNLTNRLTELDQLLHGSAIIFGKQQHYINQITHQLQQEQNNITNSAEYNANLRQDLLTLAHTRKELQGTVKELRDWKNELKFNLVPLFWPQAFYTEDTPAVAILIEKVKGLVQERDNLWQRPTSEEIEQTQTSFDQLLSQILELEQKLNLTQSELLTIPPNWKIRLTTARQRIIDLEQEKEELNSNLQTQHQQELTQKDDEITRLEKRIEDLEVERDARPRITLAKWNDYKNRPTQEELTKLQKELEIERGWWDKWEKLHDEDFCVWFNGDSPSVICSLGDKKSGENRFLILLCSGNFSNKPGCIKEAFFLNDNEKEGQYFYFRRWVKDIYEYYKKK